MMKSNSAITLWSASLAVLLLGGALVDTAPAQAMPLPLRDGGKTSTGKVLDKPDLMSESGTVDPSAAQLKAVEVLVRRYGSIVDKKPLGAGGLTAWTVEKNGRRVVLYTTMDGQAVIAGVVWESMSGRNLSDQFVTDRPGRSPLLGASTAATPVAAAASAGTTREAALVGKYSGAIPESIKAIDSLAGIKEGDGGQADTLYVIFDPRCPYCRKAYNVTRDYVKRGFTIKWIPTVVLGNAPQGIPIVASVIQAKPAEQADVLRRVLGNKEELAATPTKATQDALVRSQDFFYAAFKNNNVEKVGVPAAFFLDKHTGAPRMLTGISELPVVEAVFGKL